MTTILACEGGEITGGGRMRGDERREQLIRVAMDTFARKGFRGTTTKEIAAAAGVTEALIFRHFPTKEALYEAILRWRLQSSRAHELLDKLRALADARDDEGLFRALVAAILQFHRENPDFQRLMLYSALEQHELSVGYREEFIRPLHDFLVQYIETRQREGIFRPMNPAAGVRAVVGMPLHHAMITNLYRHCAVQDVDDETAAEEFTRIILAGLRLHHRTQES